MDLMTGYKKTDAGVIPEDWEVHPIGSVCRLINGRGFKPHEWRREGLPIIRIQNLNGSEEFNCYSGTYDPKLEVQPGQLLFAWSGSRGTSFGPHIWNGPLGLLNYHTWKVKVRESEISGDFLLHELRQLTTFIEGRAHGAAALVHVQKWQMEGFQLALPPTKAEQEAIAEALSDADALIKSLEQLLAKKRHLKQGAMQELLTGKRRLPGFKGNWEIKRLDELGRWTGGMTPSMRNQSYWANGTVPWVSSGDVKSVQLTTTAFAISDYAIKQKATTLLPAEAIIIVTRSGILRKYLPVAMNMIPMAINQDINLDFSNFAGFCSLSGVLTA